MQDYIIIISNWNYNCFSQLLFKGLFLWLIFMLIFILYIKTQNKAINTSYPTFGHSFWLNINALPIGWYADEFKTHTGLLFIHFIVETTVYKFLINIRFCFVKMQILSMKVEWYKRKARHFNGRVDKSTF